MCFLLLLSVPVALGFVCFVLLALLAPLILIDIYAACYFCYSCCGLERRGASRKIGSFRPVN